MLEPARPGRYACVVCGNLTLVDPNGAGEVCPVCCWEHANGSAREREHPGDEAGPNYVTLEAARANYARHGMADPSELYYGGVTPRPPHPWELPDATVPVPRWAAVELVRGLEPAGRREAALAAILGGTEPGLRRGTVQLVEAGAWEAAFATLAEGLRRVLPPGMGVEHVGSTAVPGLVAKPVIDVAVGLAPPASLASVTPLLEDLGYELRGDAGRDGGALFVLSSAPEHRVAHVHVVALGDEAWVAYLALRDRLRRDPAARDAYARRKRELATRFAADREAYTQGKASLIERLLAEEGVRRRG